MQSTQNYQGQPREQAIEQHPYGQQVVHTSRTNEISNSNLDQDDGFEMEPSQMTPLQSDNHNITPPSVHHPAAATLPLATASFAHPSSSNAEAAATATGYQHLQPRVDGHYGLPQVEPNRQQHPGTENLKKDHAEDARYAGVGSVCRTQQQSLESVGSQQMQRTQASEAQSESQAAKKQPNGTYVGEEGTGAGVAGMNVGGPGGQSTFSNIMSNIGSARALSMPVSGPLSAARGSSAQVTKAHHAQSQPVIELEQNVREAQLVSTEVGIHDFREIEGARQVSEPAHLRGPSSTQIETQSEADKLIGRSANAATMPLQYQPHQHQKSMQIEQQLEKGRPPSQVSVGTISSAGQAAGGAPGPSPLVRQLSEKIRLQAERLQIMEAYRALCERRILDYDPEHPMPVMPHHLGTVFTPEAGILGDEQAQNQTTADLKRLLALKEQDLLYAKQRNEKLLRELDDMTTKTGKPGGNLEALRKEIDLNEKLQKQIEMYRQKLAEATQGHAAGDPHQPLPDGADTQQQPRPGPEKTLEQERRSNEGEESQAAHGQMKALKEQVDALMEEKNALLDYIDEHVDKNVALTDRTSASQQVERLTSEIAELTARNTELTDKLQEAQAQNETLLRNQYSSPNFAQMQSRPESDSTRTDRQDRLQDDKRRPGGEQRQADAGLGRKVAEDSLEGDPEGTFGVDRPLQVQFLGQRSSDQESSSAEEKLSSLTSLQKQMQAMKQEYESLRQENLNLQASLARAEQQAQAAQGNSNAGNLSHRSMTQRSADRTSEGALSTSGHSAQKQKIRDLEMRLKASQENIKTLSQTLNETQTELENLIRDHEQVNLDLKQQLQENANMQGLLDSDQRLIEQLKNEKREVQSELAQCQADIKKLEAEGLVLRKQGEADKERSEKLETHIRSLKEDQQRRVEKVASRWEETVAELTKELESAKNQVKQREDMFYQMEEEMKKKVEGTEGQSREKSKLEQRVEDLSYEVRTLQSQKNEKDQKLKNQIRKNEELLGELQELSEAVNALKNDRELTLRSEALEEKDQVINEFENFFEHKQRRALDKIFSQFLQIAELIREFSKSHSLEDAAKGSGADGQPRDQKDDGVSSKALFLQIDRSLKNVADMQIMLQENRRSHSRQSNSNETAQQNQDEDAAPVHLLKAFKVEKDLKIMSELLKDLETLTSGLVQWNQNLMEGYKKRTQELNQTQKQLFCETDANCTLKEQVERMEIEGAHAVEKDQQVEHQLRKIGDQLVERERQMDDAYRREERLARQNQKLRTQLEGTGKDQQKIMKQVLQLIQEKEQLVAENDEMGGEMQAQSEQLRVVEYQMSAMQQQVDQINLMIDNLKASMPSEELRDLVGAMQSQIVERFTLNEQYTLKETQLLAMENQLKQLAKSDQGLSQTVIQLRKDIDHSRKDLKSMQILKKKFDRQNDEILENLKNCELVERRRHDVALETEKALVDAKRQVSDMKKEAAFANASKRDLELAVFGLQEQNGMLERELTAMRQQFAAGAYYANRTATLGGVLSKMGGGLAATPSLAGSAGKDTGRKASSESLHQATNVKGARAPSSTRAESQREALGLKQLHQTSLEQQLASIQGRATASRSYQEQVYSNAHPMDQSMAEETDQRASSMLNYQQINVPSSSTLPPPLAWNHSQGSSRLGRFGSQGKIQVQEEYDHHQMVGDAQHPAPSVNRQRSMSQGASSAAPMSVTAPPRVLDVSKGADELLAGELSRMQAVMSGQGGADIQKLSSVHARTMQSHSSPYQASFHHQPSLSGPSELVASRPLQAADYSGHGVPPRPRLPPTYPSRQPHLEPNRLNQRVHDDGLARPESVEVPLLVGQDNYLSDFGNRTYGGQNAEYGTFGGRAQLRDQLDSDLRTSTAPSIDPLRTASQSRQTHQQQINPYPSMQQIHTSASLSQGGQSDQQPLLSAQPSRNPFTSHPQQSTLQSLTRTPIFPGLQTTYGGGAGVGPGHGQRKSAEEERMNTFARTESNLSGFGNQQHSPLVPRTASAATQNTEQSAGEPRGGMADASSHQRSTSKQTGAGGLEAAGARTSEKGSPLKDDAERIRDDLPEAIEDDLDNSLLKSELLERNDGQTSVDEATGQSTNLQDKLSQVKNVFTAIRQNLHEGSTDAREASSDRTLQ